MLAFVILISGLPDVQNHRYNPWMELFPFFSGVNHGKSASLIMEKILKYCELSLTFQNSVAYPKLPKTPMF